MCEIIRLFITGLIYTIPISPSLYVIRNSNTIKIKMKEAFTVKFINWTMSHWTIQWQLVNLQNILVGYTKCVVYFSGTAFNCLSCIITRTTWYILVKPTKTFTLNKDQFLGMITNEYRAQMKPVAARAPDWRMLTVSTGLCKSPIPARTKPC